MYIDKLDDIVNKYNNTCHSTIKMKSIDVKSNTYIDFSKESNNKNLSLKLAMLLEYQNMKMFLPKVILQISPKKILWLKKLKLLCRGLMLLMILTGTKVLGCSMKNNCKKQIKKSLELRKWNYRLNVINYMLTGKNTIIHIIAG